MLEKLFGFDPTRHSVRTEILAGLTTFMMMAYILAVNPSIFSALDGMPTSAVFTTTALSAVIGTLVMAFYAKKPYALAPGMGLNAFFVYTVCISMGHPWQFALTAVFLEGLIFIVLTLTNVRELIINAIPPTLKLAIGGGIGLFIAFIGLKNTNIIVDSPATLVTLGDLTEPTALLAVIGLIIMGVLTVLKVRGGLLLGVAITAFIGIPLGVTRFEGFLSMPESVEPIFLKFDWGGILSADMVIVVLTFLFIDIFDTIGTIIGVSSKAGAIGPDGKIPGIKKMFMADAVATTLGACLGSSTVTTYVESASGVAQGGRTGLTAFVVAVCFAMSLFFSPLFLSIPASATSPVLVIVGVMMFEVVGGIDFSDYSESIPAVVCIMAMPMAYSISDGIMLGVITYVLLNAFTGRHKRLNWALAILALLFIGKYIYF